MRLFKVDGTCTTMAAKRKRKGSLQFKSKSWYAVLTVEQDGETIRRWVSLHTDSRAVANRKLAKLVANPESAIDKDAARSPETYTELAARIAARRRQEGLKDCGTEESRERIWAIPEIGPLPVAGIRPDHITAIYENARAKGRSLSLLRNLRTVLQSRFSVAVEEGTIKVSPVAHARIPKGKVDRRERAVLTDIELQVYLAWEHPVEHRRIGVLERQVMSALARMFGGLRAGDIHALQWTHFDTSSTPDIDGAFTWGMALRRKTARPQRIIVPEALRPILRDWWTRAGKPSLGLVFPVLRDGKHSKVDTKGAKHQVSHAAPMRRDLQAAFIAHREANPTAPAEILDTYAPAPGSPRWLELFEETEFTRPVDFHSWRRKFVQALADIGVTAQEAQRMAGHADLSAHERYLRSTSKVVEIPAGALPTLSLTVSTIRKDEQGTE